MPSEELEPDVSSSQEARRSHYVGRDVPVLQPDASTTQWFGVLWFSTRLLRDEFHCIS